MILLTMHLPSTHILFVSSQEQGTPLSTGMLSKVAISPVEFEIQDSTHNFSARIKLKYQYLYIVIYFKISITIENDATKFWYSNLLTISNLVWKPVMSRSDVHRIHHKTLDLADISKRSAGLKHIYKIFQLISLS